MDDDGSKKLDFDEFKKGINDYGLLMDDSVRCYYFISHHQFCDQDLKEMFKRFDKDNSGTIEFEEFLQTLRVS